MLRKKVKNPLGEPMVVVTLQVETLSFLVEMQHQGTIFEDMILGNILPILTFLDILVLIDIQGTGFLYIFLTHILGPNHLLFLNSLVSPGRNIFGMGTLLPLNLRLDYGLENSANTAPTRLFLG